MFNKTSVLEIQAFLESKPKVVIVMHRGPDGDAIGSSLGWYNLLKNQGIEATVVAPDPFPTFLKWMPGADDILVFETETEKSLVAIQNSDVIFCLDFNAPSRMGPAQTAIIDANKPIIVVDHHQEPAEFAQLYYVDSSASSTAELIYRLAKGLGWKANIDRNTAICLYTGIVTDTGSFRFPSTSPKLLRIASKLLETGMDHTEVYRNVYDSNSLNRLKLQGFALSEKLVCLEENSTAYISLSKEDLNRYNFQKGDTEGLVNYALSIEGINLAAFFAEKDGIVKISLRSRGNFDVNQLSRKHFNGGGHKNAAGGMSKDGLKETLERFEKISTEESSNIQKA